MLKNFTKLSLLYFAFYSLCFSADLSNEAIRKDRHQKYAANFPFENVFPGKADQIRKAVIAEDSISRVPAAEGTNAGLEQTQLSSFHITQLLSIPGRRVLEIGPGTGCFMAKALVNQPASYTAIELSQLAADKIPQTLNRYKKFLGDSYPPVNPRVYVGDASLELSKLAESQYAFDLVIANLSLHYMHPLKVMKTLSSLKKTLSPQGRIMCICDAPSGCAEVVDLYLEQVSGGSRFPGFLLQERTEYFNPLTKSGKVDRRYKKLNAYDHQNSDPSEDKLTSPITRQITGKEEFVVGNYAKSFFYFGKETISKLADRTELTIENISFVYQSNSNDSCTEYYSEKAKKEIVRVCFVLCHK